MSNNKNKNFIPQRKNTNPYVKKSGKLKPSFWIVLVLMIFWTVGSVFGIFATVKGCNGTSSSAMRTVSADAGSGTFYDGKIYFDEYGFLLDNISGIGSSSPVMSSPFVFRCDSEYSWFSEDWKVAIVSPYPYGGSNLAEFDYPNTGLYVRFTDGTRLPFFDYGSYVDEDGDTYYFYGLSGSIYDYDSNDPKYVDYIYWAGSGYLTDFRFNFKVATGYNIWFSDTFFRMINEGKFDNLYDQALELGRKDYYNNLNNFFKNSYVSYDAYFSNSLGQTTLSATHLDIDISDDNTVRYSIIYSNICNRIPTGYTIDDLYKVNFSIHINSFDVLTNMRFYLDGSGKTCYEKCKFGFSNYSVEEPYYDYYEVSFINKPYEYYDTDYYCEISPYEIRDFDSTTLHTFSFCITTNFKGALNCEFGLLDGDYVRGYDDGFSDGKSEIEDAFKDRYISQGYQEGYDAAYNKYYIARYNEGYNTAVENNDNFTFLSLMGAVVDAPVTAISGLLNFDLLGFNMLNFFFALCTCALIITVVRMFL